MIEPRKVLEQASIRMTKVFYKRYSVISKKLKKTLSYKNNPTFSIVSLYLLYKFIEAEFKSLDKEIEENISKEIELAYLIGFAVSLSTYYDYTGTYYTYRSVLKEVHELVDKDVLIQVKNTTMKDLLQVTRNTEYSVKKLIRETMTKHLTIDNMKNMGRKDLVGTLIKELEGKKLQYTIENNMIAIVDKAGRRWKLNNYVDMVVQTKAHQVYVKGLQDFSEQNNGKADLAVIPHNPTTTDKCLNYEGMIISMTGATEGYTTYAELKATNNIFHPRCRHQPKPFWTEDSIPKDIKSNYSSTDWKI